jgi:hypothetical protein
MAGVSLKRLLRDVNRAVPVGVDAPAHDHDIVPVVDVCGDVRAVASGAVGSVLLEDAGAVGTACDGAVVYLNTPRGARRGARRPDEVVGPVEVGTRAGLAVCLGHVAAHHAVVADLVEDSRPE